MPEKVWLELGGNVISIMDDNGYVEDCGRIICLEGLDYADADKVSIKTYDANTGKHLQAVDIPARNLNLVKMAKVAGEWFIFCGWIDPKTEFLCDKRKMWLVPYRLRDLAKAKNSIEILCGQHIEIVNGRMVLVMSDHVHIIDLSSVVNF